MMDYQFLRMLVVQPQKKINNILENYLKNITLSSRFNAIQKS